MRSAGTPKIVRRPSLHFWKSFHATTHRCEVTNWNFNANSQPSDICNAGLLFFNLAVQLKPSQKSLISSTDKHLSRRLSLATAFTATQGLVE